MATVEWLNLLKEIQKRHHFLPEKKLGSNFLGLLSWAHFSGSLFWFILLAHFLGPLSSNHFPGYTFLGPLFSDHFLGSNFLGSLPSAFFLGPTFTVNQNQIINIDQQSATQQCLVSTYVMKHDSFFGRSYSLLMTALRQRQVQPKQRCVIFQVCRQTVRMTNRTDCGQTVRRQIVRTDQPWTNRTDDKSYGLP